MRFCSASASFGLPRAFHAATLRHAAKRRPDHMQQSTDWHREALQHGPRPMDATGLLQATPRGCRQRTSILTRHGRARPPCDGAWYLRLQCCNPIEESAAPAPTVQEQPQRHLSSSTHPRRAPTGFTLFCARVAVPEYSIGAGGLMDGRMRRACSPYETWGAGQRSRFAELASNCLKDSQTNAIAENHLLRLASR